MKTILLLASMMSATVSFAAGASLEIPVTGYYFADDKEIKVDLTSINSQLKSLGVAEIPHMVIVGEKPELIWNDVSEKINAANKALHKEMHFNVYNDGYGEGYLADLGMCYRGDISAVPALLDTLMGNFLIDSQGILAIAAGKQKITYDDAFKSKKGLQERYDGVYEDNMQAITSWLKYNKKSTDVLVMSDLGEQGDGTELYATLIAPCSQVAQ